MISDDPDQEDRSWLHVLEQFTPEERRAVIAKHPELQNLTRAAQTGTLESSVQQNLLRQLIEAINAHGDSSSEEWKFVFDAAIDTLNGIQPRNVVEGMLACQLIATHFAAMESFKRAIESTNHPERLTRDINHAHKLVGLYGRLVDLMHKHRGRDPLPSLPFIIPYDKFSPDRDMVYKVDIDIFKNELKERDAKRAADRDDSIPDANEQPSKSKGKKSNLREVK